MKQVVYDLILNLCQLNPIWLVLGTVPQSSCAEPISLHIYVIMQSHVHRTPPELFPVMAKSTCRGDLDTTLTDKSRRYLLVRIARLLYALRSTTRSLTQCVSTRVDRCPTARLMIFTRGVTLWLTINKKGSN